MAASGPHIVTSLALTLSPSDVAEAGKRSKDVTSRWSYGQFLIADVDAGERRTSLAPLTPEDVPTGVEFRVTVASVSAMQPPPFGERRSGL